MKHIVYILSLAGMLFAGAVTAQAEKLVILHTNDTHSQIDPDDKDNRGGIARRKVIVDSVRAAEKNMLLVDAGDAVQGTLYFNLYGGVVEQKAMNALGYDIRILGNHEFDNGIDSLARVLDESDAEFLATNYNLDNTPLGGEFEKYSIREFDGKRIGFIAINLKPEGLISEGNYNGLEYLDAVEAANASAWWLKNIEHCDMVIALTHIGYDPAVPPGDMNLAEHTSNIDIIIGGHSHDLIDPAKDNMQWRVRNLDGKEVLVTQVGKQGKNVGEITIDLDNGNADYRVIPVTARYDDRLDPDMAGLIAPYRAGVDSLMQVPVGRTSRELGQLSPDLLNWATDIVLDRGRRLAPDVDLAILNKGGLRRGLPKGTFTQGQIITMMPFDNHIKIIDIKGADLLKAFDQMAAVGGNGVSDGIMIEYKASATGKPELLSATLNGKAINPDSTYRVATIDYLANGGDYMPSLANHTEVASSPDVLYDDVLAYLREQKNRKQNPSGKLRFVIK